MSYAFPGELQHLVQSELAKGVYANEDELLLVALKALSEREEVFHSAADRGPMPDRLVGQRRRDRT